MENVEIKARCADAAAMARAVAAAGAVCQSTFSQVDTYFNVPTGRLKLRQTDNSARELIFYRRANQHAPKLSRYDRMPIAPGQTLDFLLTQALWVKTVVRKRRQLWRLDNIRIHLDEVEGLGPFIEFEVEVLPGRDVPGCRAQAQALLRRLEIPESDLVGGSYSDLME
ncbi:MAG TPA: class IV adenylate cyclase [Candidatus Binataceae bacterium]